MSSQAEALATGERFVPEVQPDAPHAAGHVQRYHFACQLVRSGDRVLDLACGVGFGAEMLNDVGGRVVGVDRDSESVACARLLVPQVMFRRADFFDDVTPAPHDLVVSFETVEHIYAPLDAALSHLAALTRRTLVGSVPYREFPGNPFHCHFEIDERDFGQLEAFGAVSFFYQTPDGRISPDRTQDTQNLVFVLERASNVPPPHHELDRQVLVDVVVPVLEDVPATCAALDSLIRQDERRWTAWVVTRAPSDVMRSVLARYAADARIQILAQPTISLAQSIDMALQRGSAPFVGCLLPGTRFETRWLARGVSAFDSAGTARVVFGDVQCLDEQNGDLRTVDVSAGSRSSAVGSAGLLDQMIHPSSALFRRRSLSMLWRDWSHDSDESSVELSLAAGGDEHQRHLHDVCVLEWLGSRQPHEFAGQKTGQAWVHALNHQWRDGERSVGFDHLFPAVRAPAPRLHQDAIWTALDWLTDQDSPWPPQGLLPMLLDRLLAWVFLPGPHFEESARALDTWTRYGAALPVSPHIASALRAFSPPTDLTTMAAAPPLAPLPTLEAFLFWTTAMPQRAVRRHKALLADRQVLIWGAGEAGRRALVLLRFVKVSGFIHGGPTAQGQTHCGLPVCGPTVLYGSKKRPFVVVASIETSAIAARLETLDYRVGEDFALVDIEAATRLCKLG